MNNKHVYCKYTTDTLKKNKVKCYNIKLIFLSTHSDLPNANPRLSLQ